MVTDGLMAHTRQETGSTSWTRKADEERQMVVGQPNYVDNDLFYDVEYHLTRKVTWIVESSAHVIVLLYVIHFSP
jgi:hypothetical protein